MKKDGEKTKQKILSVAEKLFAEKGFDAASVDRIAKTAGVNKALIYYHFKNKNDIILSLFSNIIQELSRRLERQGFGPDLESRPISVKEKIKQEIEFLEKRKKILSVILMEAFKSNDRNNFLLKCAEIVMKHEFAAFSEARAEKKALFPEEREYLVYEFFTGFIPVVTFIVLKEKWSRYFDCPADDLLQMFMDSFERTHLAGHGPWTGD